MTQTKILTVGQATSALDIYLSANGAAVSGKYVGFQLLDASNAQVVSGVALNPALGTYTGSGIIPAGYQLGDWHINWTVITLGDGLQFATEPFTVQDIELQIGFAPAEDKTGSIYEAIRLNVGDPDGQIFNDDLLKRIVIKAVRRLNQKLGLSIHSRPKGVPGNFGGQRIKVSPLVLDTEAGTLSPSNDELCDLVILQSEVIILSSEISALKRLHANGPFGQTNISGDGISVTNPDGTNVSISPSRLTTRADLHKFDLMQKTKELEDAVKLFWNRMSGNFGKFIWG